MPKTRAKTKAGKARKVAAEMRKFKRGTLKSGSGKTVRSRRQAIAISLNQAGLSKKSRGGHRRKR